MKVLLPEAVAEDDDLARVVNCPAPAKSYGNSQHGEVIFCGLDGKNPPGFLSIVPVADALPVFAGNTAEYAALIEKIEGVLSRMIRISEIDRDPGLSVRNRGLAQQELRGDREHRGIYADAEPER